MVSKNPYLARAEKRLIGSSGRASEKRVAKVMKARLQPASGARDHSKGDMKMTRNLKFLVEAKSTTGDTLKLDLGWLMKIQSEALHDGAKPLITLSFTDALGKLRGLKEDWVCMPRSTFDELTGEE
jgi:hypothetical protein